MDRRGEIPEGFYHYYLIRMYGPVILIDKSFPIDAPTDSLKRKRSSTDESFAYVVHSLDEAIPDLPPTIENQAKEFGRITKFIAMSVKAEVLATAASPLFNGNPDYAGFKDHAVSTFFLRLTMQLNGKQQLMQQRPPLSNARPGACT
jgi:hypothetical protein